MDPMTWTTPLRLENQAARREHNKTSVSDDRMERRRSRMNSTPQTPNFSSIPLPSSSFKPRRRLLSTGDIFENMRGGPSKAYQRDVLSENARSPEHISFAGEPGRDEVRSEAKGKDTSAPSLRGLLRRASIGIKTRQKTRRPSQSHPGESAEFFVTTRPSTSASPWHKLKNVASFASTPYSIAEKSPNLDKSFEYSDELSIHPAYELTTDSAYAAILDNEPHDTHVDDQETPLPGRGKLPPYIPSRNGGGAAARATAAAQNEVLAQVRRMTIVENRENSMDWESGVEMSSLSPVDSFHSHTNPRSGTGNGSNGKQRSRVEKIDFTSHLPNEISAHIFGELDAQTLAKCELVSRRWRAIIATPAIWRTSLFREKSKAFSLGRAVRPNEGLGLPRMESRQDWKQLYRAKQEVEKNWRRGHCKASYLCGHTDSVYCLQFDEHKILTGSRDRTIRIWDLHTHRCLAIIAAPGFVPHHRGIDNWTTYRSQIAEPADLASTTTVSDVVPELYKHGIHHNASILCLQYDDDILVTGSSDFTAIVHSMQPPYAPLARLANHRAAVLDVAFDDTHIITASKDNNICVYSRSTFQLLTTLTGHTAPVNSVQINGNNVVSCSGDFSVKLWNLERGTCIREFEGHTKGLACSQFSADGRFIASAGNDKVIRVWDANTGACVKAVRAHDGLIRSLHWDNVGGRLISGSYDQDILVWDMERTDATAALGMEAESGSIRLETEWRGWHGSWVLAAKGDWRRMVSAGQDRRVLVCDFGDGVEGVEGLESRGVDADGEGCQGGVGGKYEGMERRGKETEEKEEGEGEERCEW